MKTIIPIVRKYLNSHPGIFNLSESTDAYGNYFDYDSDLKTLDNRCLFDGLPEIDKIILLRALFSRENMGLNLGWRVNVELAKLAAKVGRLVQNEAEAFLDPNTLRNHWVDCFLRVAYLGSSLDYESRLVDLILEKSDACGDGYDGLFIACWFMNSPRVDVVLAEQLTRWLEQDTLDRAGCSLTDVFHLVCKWEDVDRNSICGRMREVYRGYIQRHGDVAYFKKVGLW